MLACASTSPMVKRAISIASPSVGGRAPQSEAVPHRCETPGGEKATTCRERPEAQSCHSGPQPTAIQFARKPGREGATSDGGLWNERRSGPALLTHPKNNRK